jgi:hypothetical protein
MPNAGIQQARRRESIRTTAKRAARSLAATARGAHRRTAG